MNPQPNDLAIIDNDRVRIVPAYLIAICPDAMRYKHLRVMAWALEGMQKVEVEERKSLEMVIDLFTSLKTFRWR